MVRHIVCFKLKDASEENLKTAADLLRTMEGRCPMLREIRVGVDFLHSERSYDIILETLFDDRAALEAYQCDPYHAGTIKPHMHAVRSASVTVDYEL